VRAFEADPDAPLPSVYISFPSAKDPSWEARHGETATLEVISFAPYEWFEPWEHERWKKRGESYDELKAGYSARLLEALYEHVPETKGKVEFHELSTPLSTRHFANYGRGEIYGVSFAPERFRVPGLTPRTPIGGLFLTGQDVVAHGVVGALYSGLVTASAVLGRNVLKDVRRRAG
jgi:all-trans-retinol 13,14-reductase